MFFVMNSSGTWTGEFELDIVIMNSLVTCTGPLNIDIFCNEQFSVMDWIVLNTDVFYNDQLSDMHWRVWILILL